MFLESVRNMAVGSMRVPQPAVRGRPQSRVVRKFSFIRMFFEKLPLPHGVIQLSVGIAYFLLHDNILQMLSQTVFTAVPFCLRSHYLQMITDEHRTDTCHSQELLNKLTKEPEVFRGGGHSTVFATQIVSHFFSFNEVSFWQLHPQDCLKLFYLLILQKGGMKSIL